MDIQSLFGSIAIGKDTSLNFKYGIYGIAVKVGDSKFISRYRGNLVDVTNLTFDGTEQLIYRIPVKKLSPKDIIIRSDNPFSVLFVEEISDHGVIHGIDPSNGEYVEYKNPKNPLGINFFIKVVGPNNLTGKQGFDSLLPLLFLSGQSNTGSNDALSSYLIMQNLFHDQSIEKSLLPLLLMSNQGSGNNSSAMMLLALKDGNIFGNSEDEEEDNSDSINSNKDQTN